jgi:DNA-binding CsgD family transcriptional regulator
MNNHVTFRTEHDSDASRICAVLEALGYEVTRELEETEDRRAWAIDRISRRHKLTSREREIFNLMIDGDSYETIGTKLEISRATVKWHTHNIFTKTYTGSRADLLLLALDGKTHEPSEATDESEAREVSDTPLAAPSKSSCEPDMSGEVGRDR